MIANYETIYEQAAENKLLDRVIELPGQYHNSIEEALKINPNKMQQAALQEIQAIRDAGKKKA